jgi:hypothetical protein
VSERRVRECLMIFAVAATAVAAACADGGSRQVPLGPSAPTSGSGALTTPALDSPVSDAQLATLRPTFVVRNAGSGTGTRTYEFQISERSDFNTTVASYLSGYLVSLSRTGVPEGGSGTTSFTPDSDLQPATRLYWRARASQGSEVTAWSATGQFRTRLSGINRPGEFFEPLGGGETSGTLTGSTAFVGALGLRVNTATSFARYQLASTITSGVISVEVQGLEANRSHEKARIFSMMDGTGTLFNSRFLFNVQYRGIPGNPDNAISYKVLMGDALLKYEPDFAQRAAGVRSLNPATTYLWTASWGSTFRLEVREGGLTGTVIYDRSQASPGTYNPAPHTVFLGANDAAQESGSFAGATYRNFWVGSQQRPASLGSALTTP